MECARHPEPSHTHTALPSEGLVDVKESGLDITTMYPHEIIRYTGISIDYID